MRSPSRINSNSPDAAANPPETIGALDDQLARLTDELLTAPAPETPQQSSMKFAPTPEEQAPPLAAEPSPQPAVAAVSAPVTAPAEAPKPAVIPLVAAAPAGRNKLVQVFAKPLARKPASSASTSSADSTSFAPVLMSAWHPFDSGEWIEPGTANTSRPWSAAQRAVMSEPDSTAASTTRQPRARPLIRRLRRGKLWAIAAVPSGNRNSSCSDRGRYR